MKKNYKVHLSSYMFFEKNDQELQEIREAICNTINSLINTIETAENEELKIKYQIELKSFRKKLRMQGIDISYPKYIN